MTMINLSSHPHTWLIDIDGTICIHNGHKFDGDSLLPGVLSFWQSIPKSDTVILLTSRKECYREITIAFLERHSMRFDQIIFGLPVGERILINDIKPLGLRTAICLNIARDQGLLDLTINPTDESN